MLLNGAVTKKLVRSNAREKINFAIIERVFAGDMPPAIGHAVEQHRSIVSARDCADCKILNIVYNEKIGAGGVRV